jgi:hypothetical protein
VGRFTQADPYPGDPFQPQSRHPYAYAEGNPVKYRDPSGHWVETVWDIANIGWDIYEVRKDPSLLNIGALVVDVGAAALPFVPACAGLIARGGKAAKAAAEVAEHADEAIAAARAVSQLTDAKATITLTYKEGMNVRDFDRKVKALQDLAERGRLRKAVNPVPRDPGVVTAWKDRLRERISQTITDPAEADRLDTLVKQLNADHMQDLQLMGIDEPENLWLLDAAVNQDRGRQIWNQIRDLAPGTQITEVIVG